MSIDPIRQIMGFAVVADTAQAMKKDFPELAADLTHSVSQGMDRLIRDMESREAAAHHYDTRMREEDARWRSN